MPISCVAFGCRNRYTPGLAIHFFRFSHSNEELMKKWVKAIKRKNFKPSQYSRICSTHFTNNDNQIRPNASRPLLRSNAIPSIFPSFPKYYQTAKKPRKNPTVRIPSQINDISDDFLTEPKDVSTNPESQATKDREVQTVNSYASEIVSEIKEEPIDIDDHTEDIISISSSEDWNDYVMAEVIGEPIDENNDFIEVISNISSKDCNDDVMAEVKEEPIDENNEIPDVVASISSNDWNDYVIAEVIEEPIDENDDTQWIISCISSKDWNDDVMAEVKEESIDENNDILEVVSSISSNDWNDNVIAEVKEEPIDENYDTVVDLSSISSKDLNDDVMAEVKEEPIDESKDSIEVISISSSEDWNEGVMVDKIIPQTHLNTLNLSPAESLDEIVHGRCKQFPFYDSNDQCEESEVNVESISPIPFLTNDSIINKGARKYTQARKKREALHNRDTSNNRPKYPRSYMLLRNAKETKRRERLRGLFSELRETCNYMNHNSEKPFKSKISILIAAKNEIEWLQDCEKALIAEKEQLDTKNRRLGIYRDLLKIHAQRAYPSNISENRKKN